jgi:hypothetical protein
MNDNTVPDEFMHYFNITDDYVATEPMDFEWHQWQPDQEKPKPTKEDQLE